VQVDCVEAVGKTPCSSVGEHGAAVGPPGCARPSEVLLDESPWVDTEDCFDGCLFSGLPFDLPLRGAGRFQDVSSCKRSFS
jgi:hypothetical protein